MILRNILKNLREEFGSGIYFAKEQIDVLKPQLRADYYFFLSQIQNCNGNVLGNVFCKEHI